MTAAGQAKVNLILELKNRMKTGLSQAKAGLNKDVQEMKFKISELKSSAMGAFSELKNAAPGIGNAFALLKNPITIAVAAFAALGTIARASMQDAEEFNTKFRQLQTLNISKPIEDLKTLKRMVTDTAFKKGFDINQTSTAFFDVQSVTGKYGYEVKKIVEKQGEFAKLMQADFNAWVAGTAKAMANYGFSADKLDEFNKAAYATVKTGVTTFDELARVQSVYGGAASAAKQEFTAANKVFSLFTVKVKSVDEAATLTKSLFNDLTNASTIESFKKVGISVYDVNGKFKQADKILLELNKKFSTLGKNDDEIIALKNQFAGSEGLTAFIQAAMGNTQQLQDMITNFDLSGLDMSKALELAAKDSAYIAEELANKLKVLRVQMGESLLPMKVWWTELKLDVIDFFKKMPMYFNPAKGVQGLEQYGVDTILEKYSSLISEPGKHTSKEFENALEEIRQLTTFYQNNAQENLKYKKTVDRWGSLSSNYTKEMAGSYYYDIGALKTLGDVGKQIAEHRRSANLVEENPFAADGSTTTSTAGAGGSGSTGGLGGIDNITGSAKQVRNIEVKIGSFVDKLQISNQNTQNMDAKQMEQYMTDIFMRVVRNVETAYQ